MRRGEVFDARLDPAEGSEAAGRRPVVVVSRDALNLASPVVVVVPFTTMRPGRRVYPSHVVIQAGGGGLTADSIAQAEQVRAIARDRLTRRRGVLSTAAMAAIGRALRITLDLDSTE